MYVNIYFTTNNCIFSLSAYQHLKAEARAEFAERSVQKLQKEVDRLEGMSVQEYYLISLRL